VEGCCEYSDEPVVFDAMELVIGVVDYECACSWCSTLRF
jgi:hypothetical protein